MTWDAGSGGGAELRRHALALSDESSGVSAGDGGLVRQSVDHVYWMAQLLERARLSRYVMAKAEKVVELVARLDEVQLELKRAGDRPSIQLRSLRWRERLLQQSLANANERLEQVLEGDDVTSFVSVSSRAPWHSAAALAAVFQKSGKRLKLGLEFGLGLDRFRFGYA